MRRQILLSCFLLLLSLKMFCANAYFVPKADFSHQIVACVDSGAVKFTDLSTDANFTIIKWEWTMKNGAITLTSTNRNPTFKVGDSGTWQATLKVTNFNQEQHSVTKNILLNIIKLNVKERGGICEGDDYTLIPNPDTTLVYNWSPSNLFTNPKSPLQIVKPSKTTSYSVNISNTERTCILSKVITVTVLEKIKVQATANKDTIDIGESVQLSATKYANFEYDWIPRKDITNSDKPDASAAPEETTTYTVAVSGEGQCPNTAEVTVYIREPACGEPYVFIPNAFTPNNDGENDEFRVRGKFIDELYFCVFNRWGQKLFETQDKEAAWNGTYLNQQLSPDVFGYYAKVKCSNGKEYVKKGNVTLIR